MDRRGHYCVRILVLAIAARELFYTLCDDKHVAFVFSHLILASKISMPPTLHVVKENFATYELTHDVEKVILEAFNAFRLLD
jgi:hypothetical protein